MKKAVMFVDANNWYHNVKGWFVPSDVDICKIAELISRKKNLDVLEIRWYASIPDIEDDKLKYMRHMGFLSSLKKRGVKVITRKLQKLSNKELKKRREDFIDSWDLCSVCKPLVEASFLDLSDHHQKEKGIDVWIAIDMVKEAIQGNVDCCVLISGDADFVPALNLIKEVGKRYFELFYSKRLFK
jgi:uncharacterized LabA/DUF88 family protein